MKKLIILFLLVFLTGCGAREQHAASEDSHAAISPEQVAPVRLPETGQTISNQPIDPAYKKIVVQYTADMNDVIQQMSTSMDQQTAQKQFDKVKQSITHYEQRIHNVPVANEMPDVNQHIEAANEGYLSSMKKIVEGIEKEDEPLKASGFEQFTKTHQLLNMVSYAMVEDTSPEMPDTEAPSLEEVQTEIYTAPASDLATTEKPK